MQPLGAGMVRGANALGAAPSALEARPVGIVLRPGRRRSVWVDHRAVNALVALLGVVVSADTLGLLIMADAAIVIVIVLLWGWWHR